MFLISSDDYFDDTINKLFKFSGKFTMPTQSAVRRSLLLAVNILELNKPNFVEKFESYKSLGCIEFSRNQFFAEIEPILIRLLFLDYKAKLYKIPQNYGERFAVLFCDSNTYYTDLVRKLSNRQTETIRERFLGKFCDRCGETLQENFPPTPEDEKSSELEKLTTKNFMFLMAIKTQTIGETLVLLDLYENRECPLKSDFICQLVVDRCITEGQLNKVNSILKKIGEKKRAYHEYDVRFSNLKLRNSKMIHEDATVRETFSN